MNINFSAKELKTKKLEAPGILVAYLMAIHNTEPAIWAQFKYLIKYVEDKAK